MSEKNPVLEAVQAVSVKIDEQKTATEKRFEESKKMADDLNKKLEDEVKTLNEDLAKKGKSLEEINTAITELKAKRGRFSAVGDPEEKSTKEILQELFRDNHAKIKSVADGNGRFAMETKTVGTMTASANITGNVVSSYMLTPAVRGRRKVHFQDLVNTIQSSTGVWKFFRQNIPAGEGSFGFQTTHGAAKAQLDYDLTEVTETTEYLAGFARFARQMAEDLPFLESFIANELLEDYKRQEDLEFFGELRSAATGSTTTSASVYAEKLIDYIGNMMDNDYEPTSIVTTSANWATLLKTKPADYSIPGGITISPEGTVMIAGIPVYVANSLYLGSSSNKTLVADWSQAAIIQSAGLRTSFSEEDADNFTKNLITAKLERRVALAILRPDAFIYA